ncbi:MAG: site-specific DNA-methyltransferase, partial [Tissierellia bacterium]|nr:site-specific DNA-methyltransferase [Tissierellia bacterium]
MDERIIGLLLDREETRKKFFLKVKDAYIFKSKEFKFFIEEHKVFNSYTSYPNRIGLYDGKEFIMDRTEVVINFPFKDCILEGGQTTEEGIDTYFEYDEKVTKTQEKQGWEAETYNKKQDKRKEIFFNEILAQDEIDRLLDEKAFVNWRRYTKNGVEEVEEIKRDKNGLIRENLIIKGNNLLALESLKSQFKGQIKLIYIDPPYYFMDNKDQDSFRYNTNFKLSTWLTFMKNRLEIAKELLKDDGVIFVQIDDDGQAYLKVLMDEIFGQKNYLNTICVKMKNIAGASGGGEDKKLKKNIE